MSDYNSCQELNLVPQELNLVPQELSYEHWTVCTEFLYIHSKLTKGGQIKKKYFSNSTENKVTLTFLVPTSLSNTRPLSFQC